MRGIFNKDGLARVLEFNDDAIARRVLDGMAEDGAQADILVIDEAKAYLKEGRTPPPPSGIIVDDSVVLLDQKWRKAWIFDDGEMKGDSENARDVALERLRTLRDAEMIEADKAYTRADGRGNQPEKIAAEARRESLRGATDPLKAWTSSSPIMSLTDIEAELSPLEVLP